MPRPIPPRAFIPVIALRPLPGSPGYDGDRSRILEQALSDLELYRAAGAHAVLLENSRDLPYVRPPLDPEARETVEEVTRALRRAWPGPLGLQLLEAANLEALEIAARADADFLRVEGYVFAHVGGAGLIEGCAGHLLRRRRELGVPGLAVFADVKKKHCAHALTADLTLADVVRQAEFFLADGVIVTGPRTGVEPDPDDLRAARAASPLPRWIGSGLTPANLREYLPLADGFVVGSTLRRHGRFLEETDPDRLRAFAEAFHQTP